MVVVPGGASVAVAGGVVAAGTVALAIAVGLGTVVGGSSAARAQDLTQEALAELSGCAVATLRLIETGRRRRPSRELAAILAERLTVPADERAHFLQLARGTVPAAVPPAVPAAVPPAILAPSPVDEPLIGRASELAALCIRLADPACRLLTIVGPGGIGKTRLARHLAQEVQAGYPDRARLVLLAGAASPAAALTALAATLGMPAGDDADLALRIVNTLRDRQMLLVLDNLEQLLSGDELLELLAAILAAAPGVRLLATSRERLHIRDEWVYELGGLATEGAAPVADAVLLLLERARRQQSDFALTPANAPAIQQICRMLGGSPLAIELATAWLPVLNPDEIVVELTRNLDLLVARERDIPHRHRSLRAVFAHSWALLTPAEQTALARLSIFRGGFTREAAAYVAGTDLALLAALIQKSLLQRVGERYMLHELTRQYAEEQRRASDAAETTIQRFIAYYQALGAHISAGVIGDGQPDWFRQFAIEADNWQVALNAALLRRQSESGASLCVGIRLYWVVRGLPRTGLHWIEQFLGPTRSHTA